MRAELPRFQNLWELTVLCTLRESPMHPYEILRLLKERHKEDVLVLKRGSLYHAIERLLAAGHIEELDTRRPGRRPERTRYRLTEAGDGYLLDGLRRLVAVPRHEASEFMAAMNFLVHLGPRDALAGARRAQPAARVEIALTEEQMGYALGIAGRVNLLETEYQQAMRRAELAWIRGLAGDLRSGRLDWNIEALLALPARGARTPRRARGGFAMTRALFVVSLLLAGPAFGAAPVGGSMPSQTAAAASTSDAAAHHDARLAVRHRERVSLWLSGRERVRVHADASSPRRRLHQDRTCSGTRSNRRRGTYDWTAVDAFVNQLKSPDEGLVAVFSASEWATSRSRRRCCRRRPRRTRTTTTASSSTWSRTARGACATGRTTPSRTAPSTGVARRRSSSPSSRCSTRRSRPPIRTPSWSSAATTACSALRARSSFRTSRRGSTSSTTSSRRATTPSTSSTCASTATRTRSCRASPTCVR